MADGVAQATGGGSRNDADAETIMGFAAQNPQAQPPRITLTIELGTLNGSVIKALQTFVASALAGTLPAGTSGKEGLAPALAGQMPASKDAGANAAKNSAPADQAVGGQATS